MYEVEHLVTGKLRDVRVVRMRFYADDQLEITGEPLKVFQLMENQGESHIRSILAIKPTASSDEFVVRQGLEEAESTWELVSRVFHDASAVLRKKQGAAAASGAEAGARAAARAAFVIILRFGGSPGF